jgi:anaerobic ribonucleoside-triphosphate reductase activating protein
MLQAAGLAQVIRLARQTRDLSLIVYSGFILERLHRNPPGPGVSDLLEETDVLIDGVYIARLNDNHGLRGSSNQHVHFLTDRLSNYDFEKSPRRIEIHVGTESILNVGVPSIHAPVHLNSAFTKADSSLKAGYLR